MVFGAGFKQFQLFGTVYVAFYLFNSCSSNVVHFLIPSVDLKKKKMSLCWCTKKKEMSRVIIATKPYKQRLSYKVFMIPYIISFYFLYFQFQALLIT